MTTKSRSGRIRTGCWLTVAAVFVLPVLLSAAASAQSAVSVRDLRISFDTQFKNELVLVHGWVSSERRVPSQTFKGYYLKDRFGDFILIRTTQSLPEINSEVEAKGVAIRDADTGEVYLSETERDVLRPITSAAPGGSAPTGTPGLGNPTQSSTEVPVFPLQPTPEEAAGRWSTQTRILVGVGAAIVLLVGAAIFLLTRRRDAPMATTPAYPWSGGGEPASASGVAATSRETFAGGGAAVPGNMECEEFRTVKVYKTTKMLPGKLVILENKQETDTIHLTDQSGHGEIEIGRDSPDATGGIRIKDRSNTLSRRQARLVFDVSSRTFSLVNVAGESSNPTSINGRPMRENESVALADGDVLVMGNLEMRFRRK